MFHVISQLSDVYRTEILMYYKASEERGRFMGLTDFTPSKIDSLEANIMDDYNKPMCGVNPMYQNTAA